VRALERTRPILMLDVVNVDKTSCSCLCNGTDGRLRLEQVVIVSTKMGDAVYNQLDPTP